MSVESLDVALVLGLLDAGRWNDALATIGPPSRRGDLRAVRLLVTLVESSFLHPWVPAGANWACIPPLPTRLNAAAMLGALGDPRLLDLHHSDAPLGGYWCPIEAGPFWYGAYVGDEDEQCSDNELHQVVLPYSYQIARYLVTNTEYGRFIAHKGYTTRRWWTKPGWKWKHTRTQPSYWAHPRFNQPNQPVVDVSWYEVTAYCTWLTEQGRAAGWLSAGEEIRLPTSLEWERAARGTTQQRYPWGDAEPDAERANYWDTKIGQPTPVGCFPDGQAACGALDMVGNVQEWMSTFEHDFDQLLPQRDATSNDRFLLAWSVFGDFASHLHCAIRGASNPGYPCGNRSFRVVWAPVFSDV